MGERSLEGVSNSSDMTGFLTRTTPAAVWHRAKLDAGKRTQEAMLQLGAQWVAMQGAGSA